MYMKTSLLFPSTTFPLWDRIFHWPAAHQRSQRSSSLRHLSSTMTTTATPQFCLLIHWRMYKFILCLVLCKYCTTHESADTSSKRSDFTSFVFMLRTGITGSYVSYIYQFLNFFIFKMLIVYIYCTKGHFHINTCYLFKFFEEPPYCFLQCANRTPQWCTRDPFYLHPCWWLSFTSLIAILMDMSWCLTVILICISLKIYTLNFKYKRLTVYSLLCHFPTEESLAGIQELLL